MQGSPCYCQYKHIGYNNCAKIISMNWVGIIVYLETETIQHQKWWNFLHVHVCTCVCVSVSVCVIDMF